MLVVHHWDTDGICSAAMLRRIMDPSDFENMSPPIGDFSFDERIISRIEGSEDIFVVDLNLPHVVEKIMRKITFIDHHHQPKIKNPLVNQINPLLMGRNDYPSATCVVSDEYDSWNELSVLGAVGDVGSKAFYHDKVKEVMKSSEMDENDFSRLVALIDSNYIAMEQGKVEEAVDIVFTENVRDLLDRKDWNDQVESIERTIDRYLDEIIEIDGFAYMNIDCKYNIISKLARIATWEKGYKGAVVLNSGFNGKAQTYFRVNEDVSRKMNIPKLIDDLKNDGINAGGKSVVVGSIYEKERIPDVMEKVRETSGLEGLEW